MERSSDIQALLKRAEKTLPKITKEYEKALNDKSISSDLKIDIKDYFGNLRSVLDYIAHEIIDKYCPKANLKNNIYFPICSDQVSFEKMINKLYPELETNCREVYDILNDIQPFKRSENIWLSHFNKLNNEHKHERLVAQIRSETKRVNVKIHGGGSVSWDPSAVKFGSGVFFGGVPVNPQTQMPYSSNTQTVTVDTWVDFQFEDINISAIWLTRESLKRIQDIYKMLKNKL